MQVTLKIAWKQEQQKMTVGFFWSNLIQRALSDYRTKSVANQDSVPRLKKNKTETVVPIPVYRMKKSYLKWLEQSTSKTILPWNEKLLW
jgi:hypothetical protein